MAEKFSDFIRAPGTAGPPTQEGISALGFVLSSEVPDFLGKYVRVDASQSFTAGEKTQARANIGAVIGTDVQAFSVSLNSLAGLTTGADSLPYTTSANTWAVTTITAFGRSLIDDANSTAARATLGLGNVDNTSDADKPVSTATQTALNLKANSVDAALTAPTLTKPLGEFLRGYVAGLVLSNNITDTTNDIDIAAGSASSDGATPVLMTLASAITKRLDAAWAVGNGNGGLDTGTIANTTYHVWLIQRSDTGVVDALFSTSATSPTMPTNYDRKRRVGAILRESGVIVPFTQYGRSFKRKVPFQSVNDNALAAVAKLGTLAVPTGIKVEAMISGIFLAGSAVSTILYVSDPDQDDATPNGSNITAQNLSTSNEVYLGRFFTNTSGQVRYRAAGAASGNTFTANVIGWVDHSL